MLQKNLAETREKFTGNLTPSPPPPPHPPKKDTNVMANITKKKSLKYQPKKKRLLCVIHKLCLRLCYNK